MISLCDLTRPPALLGGTSFHAPTGLSIPGHLHPPTITQSVGPLPNPPIPYPTRWSGAGSLIHYSGHWSITQSVGPLPNLTVHYQVRLSRIPNRTPILSRQALPTGR